MRQVIPFKKDIVFNTKIEEITSISLEHNLKLDNDNFISGEFVISGDYKIVDGSSKLELFSYNLPIDIALDNSYVIEESTIDIEDFYYEIINNDTLRVNIEVSIEGEEKQKENVEDVLVSSLGEASEEINVKEETKENGFEISSVFDTDDIREDAIIETKQEEVLDMEVATNDNVKSLFSAINSEEEETFTTYHVHIVKENEDCDTILKKYNITKEEFLNYNTMDEIVLGNKLIIPDVKDE